MTKSKKVTEKNRFDKALSDIEREVEANRMSVGVALARAFLLGSEHRAENVLALLDRGGPSNCDPYGAQSAGAIAAVRAACR